MAYVDEVLADAPWGFWQQSETSGSALSDSSPNARPMAVTGAPSLAQPGPFSGANAVTWPATTNTHAETSATVSTTTATLEAWVKLSAYPASGGLPIVSLAASQNSGTYDKMLYVASDGAVGFFVWNGANRFASSTAVLSLGVWYHLVASVGPAGMKIRANKTLIANQASVTSSFDGTMKVFVRGGGTGGAILRTDQAVTIALPAFYTTQLSDARADAHYDAALSGAVSIAGLPATIAVAGRAGATVVPISVAGAAANVTVAAHAGTPGIPVAVVGDAANVAVAGMVGSVVSGSSELSVAGSAANVAVLGQIGVPLATIDAETDQRDRRNGRSRTGLAYATVDPALAALPAREPHRAMAQSVPAPTLDDGRPL